MGRKWANIAAKKSAKDGATSKVYAKFGVEIYVAAKQGEPDPESNTALKFVIERAKQAQVPKHVIDKAIDKAKGGAEEAFRGRNRPQREIRFRGLSGKRGCARG